MVKVAFDFTEEFFLELNARYQAAGSRRYWGIMLRSIGAITCLYFSVRTFQSREFGFLAFFVFATVFFAFFGHFTNVIARNNHRRSPYNGERVEFDFSDEGIDMKSPTTDVQCRWGAFTKVTEFSDGLLMYRGSLFHWIPIRAITTPDGAATLRDLAKSHVSDYSVNSALKT